MRAKAGVGWWGGPFFSIATPIQSSLPFAVLAVGVHFSRDPIHAFNDGIKIRENRGL